jgi:hypothetical protein
MPAKEEIDQQTNYASATPNSGPSKHPDSRRPFGPMLTADSNKKFVLCITDAFTKYAVVTAIANKEAEMVADAIVKDWFAKFGIPAQVHTYQGKEFVNFRQSFSNYSTSATQKHHQRNRNAMPKWKCLTRQ